jgi:uncharacterized protein (DUF1330 family)
MKRERCFEVLARTGASGGLRQRTGFHQPEKTFAEQSARLLDYRAQKAMTGIPDFQMEEHGMAKGYWVAHIDVTDPEAYKGYVARNGKAFARYGARFLVRGGRFESKEGASRSRNVVIEFKDYETALACYHSAEYAEAMKHRVGASVGEVIVIEGYDGPQPA